MKIDWTNPASVTSALTAILGTVVGVIAVTHPGFRLPTSVEASLSAVGFLIAGVAGVAHTWHLTKVHVARIAKAEPAPAPTPSA
jgi:uncharacterized membrane-anchored protein